MQYYQRLDRPMEPPDSPPTIKGPQNVSPIYPSLEEFKKLEGKDYNKKFDQEMQGAMIRQIN